MGEKIDTAAWAKRVVAYRQGLRIPAFYSAGLHLCTKTLLPALLIFLAIVDLRVQGAQAWYLLLIVPALLVGSLLEYIVHRLPMHRRWPIFTGAYRGHTLVHHRVFAPGAMEINSFRELFYVVFNWRFDVFVASVVGLFYFAAYWLGLRGAGDVIAIVMLAYAWALDFVHILDHLPVRLLRRYHLDIAPVRWWRTHHTLHHDPRQMKDINFSICLPFGDWLMRTLDVPAEALEAEKHRESNAGSQLAEEPHRA